ncbi:MAG: hypothetical protein JWO30_144 [Fibrobacteres bacterium]|nr:hypothetical protein [Fibrobacterota bacterium]
MRSGQPRSCFRALRRAFPAAFLFLSGVLFPLSVRAQADRFFQPSEGFVRAKDLPENFSAKVRSIQLDTKDAFEGSTSHSEAESRLFELGNKLHIESRPGTIRRRLLFREGDIVTKGTLLETEKTLRQEEFLADAIIEVLPWQDGTVHVKVTTYDQWTTVPGFSLQRLGGEWIYWVGPVESNLLGTGQRLGFFVGHDQFRDTRWLDYNNNALTDKRLHLTAHTAWLSDGYSVLGSLSKPLESRTSEYGFTATLSAVEFSEYVYFDANRLKELPDSLADAKAGVAHPLVQFSRVATHDLDLSVTRSYGYKTKFNVSPTFNRHDRYNDGSLGTFTREADLLKALPLEQSAKFPDERMDYLLGANFSMYQYAYKTVQNFNNLKWSETLETGWRLSTKVAQNQAWMGATNNNFLLSHSAVYNNAWWDAVFFNSNATMRYFVAGDGRFDDGSANAAGSMQWKPVPITSSFLSVSWSNLFASEQSQQLLLGEDNGLNGYPNFYYAGQARILFEAEQRLFPSFEAGTLVPAFAVFANAGNTFPSYSQMDLHDLHYSVGFGLRLGASKSVQKVVNHVNFSFPLDKEFQGGSVWDKIKYGFSIRAKKSL